MRSRGRETGTGTGTREDAPDSSVAGRAPVPAPRYRLSVRSTGGERTSLGYRQLVALPWETRRYEYRCASGDRWGGLWRGLPVARLVEAAPVGERATHLRIESDDAAACVPVATALGGLLAFRRDGRRLPLGDRAPRFLAPGIESIRTLKGVERIAGCRLAPGEDRAAHESFPDLE